MIRKLISFENLDTELKEKINQLYPKDILSQNLIKITQTDKNIIYGIIHAEEDIEYLIKMITAPIDQSVNIDAYIENLDKINHSPKENHNDEKMF